MNYIRGCYLEGVVSDQSTMAPINGANIQIAYKLANTLVRQKKYTEAIEFYNKVINNKPNFGGAYLNRGNAYFFSNNSELACSDWQKAIENGTERAQQMIETYCK